MMIYRLSMLTLLSMGLVSCGEDTILGCANEPPGSLITNVEVIDLSP
jgi:hypothetical protein